MAAGGSGGAGLGGDLGLLVWRQGPARAQPRLLVRASTESLLLPGAAVGEEARGGLRLGPHGRSLGLDLGAELAWSRLDLPGMALEPSLGLAVPIGVSARVGPIELGVEVERLWLTAPERRGPVGWKGDEQALSVSLGHRPRATSVSLRYRLHQSAEGQVHGLAMRLGA